MSDTEKKRLLFVDDEPHILDSLKRMLWKYRDVWDFTSISNPLEAKELAQTTPFDVAILDVNMPRMTGLELLEFFKKTPSTQSIQVIILTGMMDTRLKSHALDLGATDLLNKPVMKDDLIARISNALRIKDYQDELEKKNQELQNQLILSQKMELVGILSAGVVHDLKNIMAVISGYSEIIAMSLSEDNRLKSSMDKIREAAGRASRIMMQILGFSKSSRQTEIIEVSSTVNDSMGFYRAFLPKHVQFQMNLPIDKMYIKASSTQFTQMLMNLVLNAGQATKNKGTVTVSLDRLIFEEEHPIIGGSVPAGKYVALQVNDQGVGMKKDTLENIFDPYYSTKKKKGGTGLGLTVVKWIVEKIEGYIHVESEIGTGTTFHIYIPEADQEKIREELKARLRK